MGFDLGAMLAQSGVQVGHNDREQIEYIPLEKLTSDKKNYFKLSGLSALADNIATIGLQQPIRVRPDGDGYRIVSGHRRTAALRELQKEAPEKWSEAPCIVETDEASPALQELRLIYANANIRQMTPSEISETAERTEMLLYQLQKEGMEFPGRMRDHVSKAVGVSKTKLARLAVIRKGLKCKWPSLFKRDAISEDTAYHLAQLPEYLQAEIEECAGEYARSVSTSLVDEASDVNKRITTVAHLCGASVCPNRERMIDRTVKGKLNYAFLPKCPGCCVGCPQRFSCSASCHRVEPEKKQYRAERKAELQADKERKTARERPVIQYLKTCYGRVVDACANASVSFDSFAEAASRYSQRQISELLSEEKSGTTTYRSTDSLPYGYAFTVDNAKGLCQAADLLGVTTDYLLGRDPTDCGQSGWLTGMPPEFGDYVAMYRMGLQYRLSVDFLYYGEGGWTLFGTPVNDIGVSVAAWSPVPVIYAPEDDDLLEELSTAAEEDLDT